jgi:hypothetical protein
MIKKLIPVLGFVVITLIFFWQFFLKGLVPIPTDTIVGLYHPYRDIYAKDYPNGIPFKNFLITDPVRQQYPWKNFSIEGFKNKQIPSWNPYSFSGTPNLANFQSGGFYPFNLILFLFSFEYSWSIFVMLQPLLAGIFMYFYLKNLRLNEYSSFFGGIVFAFGGFFATWLEWGSIVHTGLWLPLILLAIDKIVQYTGNKKNVSENIAWCVVLIISIASSFFAGHLQTFFYIFLIATIYTLLRILKNKKNIKNSLVLFFTLLISLVIISIQLIPTFKFIMLSGRNLDQLVWQKEGWFIPYKHLLQFLVPDFFGNTSTLNYWGTWNYGEMTGYMGINVLILSLLAIMFIRRKIVLFYGLLLGTALILATPNLFSRIPFIFNIPFISTAQPTRFMYIADFALSVLAAFGLHYIYEKGKFKEIVIPIIIIGILFAGLFGFTFIGSNYGIDSINITVAKRNIIFPGLIFILSSVFLIGITLVKKKFKSLFLVIIILITIIDLFRFSWKFNTFSKKEYLYPETSSINYIKNNIGNFRIATNDSRILPPNFSIMYKISSAEGYDPLYTQRYAEFISAINRNEPNVNPPFGFNRIIRIENFSSPLIDLLGIKYVLSLNDMNTKGFLKVFEEGQTKVYENIEVLPKAFFVGKVKSVPGKQAAIDFMFEKDFNPKNTAVIEEIIDENKFNKGVVSIIKNYADEIVLESDNKSEGFLVLTDTFYPTWHVMINNQEVKIYRTDFNFRGIIVPAGKRTIVFKNKLL